MLMVNRAQPRPLSDVIHTRRGEAVRLRFAAPADAAELQAYIRSLSPRSRYNRFFGALSELPQNVLHEFVDGKGDRYTLLAMIDEGAVAAIVGEARYVFDRARGSIEFGLSVQDRWQGHGIGPALLRSVECRAAGLGATSLFGDTLRSNDIMITAAQNAGYLLRQHPDDWRLVRFEKRLADRPTDIASAGLRLAPSMVADILPR
jgi:GNAT superfamily N-acetyltransferase